MAGLQRKPGQGLDLRQFGKADIQRASLIEWDAKEQAWFIDILQEAGRGKVTEARLNEAGLVITQFACTCYTSPTKDEVVYFFEYDDAVKVEIAYLDALRLAGHY